MFSRLDDTHNSDLKVSSYRIEIGQHPDQKMILNGRPIRTENDIHGISREEPSAAQTQPEAPVQRKGSTGKIRAPLLPPHSQFSYWPAQLAAQ